MSCDRGELKVYPPVLRWGVLGRWVRDQLQAGILRGTPVLLRIQSLRTPALNTTMKVISFLGEEEFYTPLVAIIVWIVDARLGRLLALLMALGFYLTGVFKNLLCLPRPPSPPIEPLQQCNDWGLPSHHAVLSVNIPWYIWLHVYLNYSLSSTALALLFSLIALWSFCVMFSRLYLGVHSPADILTGGVMGCLLLAVWLQVDALLDSYLASSLSSILLVLPVVVGLLYLHPDPPPTTIVFAETVCMVGVAFGFLIGRAIAPPSILYAVLERRYTYSSALAVAVCSVVRFLLGFALLLGLKMAVGGVSKAVLGYGGQLAGVPTVCMKRRSKVTSKVVHYSPAFQVMEEPPSPKVRERTQRWSLERPLNLDIPVKFLSYSAMGLVAVHTAPLLFHLVGI